MAFNSDGRKAPAAFPVLVFFLGIPIILLHVLVLIGCVSSSPGLQNIFLVDLSSNNPITTPSSHLRIGNFGICALHNTTPVCMATAGRSVKTVMDSFATQLGQNNDTSTMDLVQTGITMRGKILPPIFVASGLCFTLGLMALGIANAQLARSKLQSGTAVKKPLLAVVSKAMLCFSTGLVFGTSLSTTMTISGMAFIARSGGSNINVLPGILVQTLQWAASGLLVLFTLGAIILLREEASQQSDEYPFPSESLEYNKYGGGVRLDF